MLDNETVGVPLKNSGFQLINLGFCKVVKNKYCWLETVECQVILGHNQQNNYWGLNKHDFHWYL